MSATPMKKPNEDLLKSVPLDSLEAHPQNPRKIERRDVIEQIAAQIRTTGVFDPSHALLVRPMNGGHQIVSGHHRAVAAREAGLTEVPAWVRDLSDEEAFLQLLLGNAQGELHPLEKGAHALDAVERGMTVRDYAIGIGAKKEQTVYTQMHAAEVAIMCAHNFLGLKGYVQHLSLIHAADREDWKQWVMRTLENNWSVDDLREELRRHKPIKTVPGKKFYLIEEWETLSSADRERVLATPATATLNSQDTANIEWARWSWNPVTGCLHNCPYCYARDIANRFYTQAFAPSLVPGALKAPSNTEPPQSGLGMRNIFVCSMADLFGKWVPIEWIEAVLAEVRANPKWNFLFLTKFPQRMAEFDFPANAWPGTSVDFQVRVKNAERSMAKVKAKVRWLSIEPLLEPIQMDWSLFQWIVIGGASGSTETPAWTPPRKWVWDITFAAQVQGCAVYHKDNIASRLRDYPGAVDQERAKPPEPFHYLKVLG